MVMNLNSDVFANFAEKRKFYADLVKGGATNEEQTNAFAEMMEALGDDTQASITEQVQAQTGALLEARKHDADMTNEELDFFNAIAAGDLSHGESKEVTLPETTVDKIFEDLVSEHPFLATLKLQTTGLRLKFLKSDAKGTAAWGKIYDGIKSQLTATFSEEDATQSKLTAFVAVPNDVLEFGAPWIKTFVQTQITEAFAVALELAFVTGDGNNQPIGLNRQVKDGVTVTGGAYPEKTSAGTITLADTATAKTELGKIVKFHSKKENGKSFAARGKIFLLVAPGVSIDFESAMTMQNVNGQWVFALPYGLQVVESEAVSDGKMISYVGERYDAYTAGGINIKMFDQTLALEDGTLYTAKQFAYGKAADDNVAQAWDLKIGTESK